MILNAYRDQLYLQQFNQGVGTVPQLLNHNEVQDYLANQTEKIICCGSGLSEIYTEIKELPHLFILPRFPRVKAIHVCRYAQEKINNGQLTQIKPLYIRPPDAKLPN